MSINYGAMSDKEVTFPQFFAKDDLPWLRGQLLFLNFEDRKKVCDEYWCIYIKNGVEGRRLANTHLKHFVDEHGRDDTTLIKKLNGNIPESIQKRLDRIRERNPNRKSILGMADERST